MKLFKLFVLIATFGLLVSSCASASNENWDGATPEPVNVSTMVDDILTSTISYSPMLEEVTNYWNGVYEVAFGVGATTYARGDFLGVGESTDCGGITVNWDSSNGPEYCLNSDNIIIPVSLTKHMFELGEATAIGGNRVDLSSSGEAGVYAIIAHEYGHNIEGEVLGKDLYARIFEENMVLLENSADCISGVTLAGVNRVFSEDEVKKIVSLFYEIGESEGLSHGTPIQRANAILDGMRFSSGSQGLEHCLVTYIPGYVQG